MTRPLIHGGHPMGVLQLVNKEDWGFFSAQDVIKLIKEVANIDLALPPKPHRRKDDPRY